nr:hypothetical protein [uncultured Celeribacter sp.]
MQTGDVIYQSEHISARYVACDSTHVVVSFPDRVHPLGINQPGWGETFLNKRGISAIYIALTETNWFQCPDFFEAMRACRGFLGPDVPVTAYGSSMGGYGALLAAKTLEASLCIALSPQISIDPEVVPFERRYLAFAKEIGPFLHDVSEQAGPGCHYVIAYDPLHGKDRKHVLRCSKHFQITELPVYCGSHGVLNLLKRAEAIDCLADLLVEKATPGDLRRLIRDKRRTSARYLKKMGRRAAERGHKNLYDYAQALNKLTGLNATREQRPPEPNLAARPKLVIHCGLPKTGTSSLQAYFYTHAKNYQQDGIFYPTQNADKNDLNHAWFSQQLRDASVDQLCRMLETVPEGVQTVFLSDESLFVELPGLTDDTRKALYAALDGYEIELVLFEREQTAWMRNFYLQSVQNRRAGRKTAQASARNLWQTSLDFKAFFAQPFCQKLLDTETMKRELRNAFGTANLRVLPFEPGKDVVEVFCAELDWPHMGHGPTLALNPPITDSQAEILRQANGMSNSIGRFIKKMIELPDDYAPDGLRPKLLEKLLKHARDIPWQRFQFQENPPLSVTPESFDEALEVLRLKTERLGLVVERKA